jgi:hypothetical protein
MDLVQDDQDVAAKSGITLGDAAVDALGNWAGQWKTIDGGGTGSPVITVAPASATLLRFSPSK